MLMLIEDPATRLSFPWKHSDRLGIESLNFKGSGVTIRVEKAGDGKVTGWVKGKGQEVNVEPTRQTLVQGAHIAESIFWDLVDPV